MSDNRFVFEGVDELLEAPADAPGGPGRGRRLVCAGCRRRRPKPRSARVYEAHRATRQPREQTDARDIDLGLRECGPRQEPRAARLDLRERHAGAALHHAAAARATTPGAMWGQTAQPPTHVFVRTMQKHRKQMYERISAMLERQGLRGDGASHDRDGGHRCRSAAIDNAVVGVLLADSTLAALLPDGVYFDVAKPKAHALRDRLARHGGRRAGPRRPRRIEDVLYLVKAVGARLDRRRRQSRGAADRRRSSRISRSRFPATCTWSRAGRRAFATPKSTRSTTRFAGNTAAGTIACRPRIPGGVNGDTEQKAGASHGDSHGTVRQVKFDAAGTHAGRGHLPQHVEGLHSRPTTKT